MIGVTGGPTAKAHLASRVRALVGVRAGIVSFSLALTTGAALALPVDLVAADQVSDLKAQADQIAHDLVLEQLQIGAYQQQYDVDVAKVQRDEKGIRSTQDQIQADVGRVGHDRKRLQAEAMSAYINTGSDIDGNPPLFAGNQDRELARAEYEKEVTGDIAATIDALHLDENGLSAERAALGQQEARDQATTNQEAVLTDAAHRTQGQLQSKQSEITGELAVAVAQQQATQAAAAAAAVRAAQAAASRTTSNTSTTRPAVSAQPASSTTATTAPGTNTGTPTADPSLPPFLQCVLQAESGGNYGAVSPGGTYMGGFQFSQVTWNEAAGLAGMPQLVDVPPNQATPAQQDDLAIALYDADGQQPWLDRCATG